MPLTWRSADMASRPISPEQMLAAIPSLPRPMLARLVDHMIDRLDDLDGDADQEDNGDAEPVDEREPEEEYGFRTGSPVVTIPSRHTVAVPVRWRLSIGTRTALLTLLRSG